MGKHIAKLIDQTTEQISKIAAGLMKNLEQYQKAKKKGQELSKFISVSKQLTDTKKRYTKELDNLILKLDKNVELVIGENKTMKKSILKQIIIEEYKKLLEEGFGTWEVVFGRGKVSGVDYHAAGKITVSARTTVEAIKKAAKQAAKGAGNKLDWMAVDVQSLKKK